MSPSPLETEESEFVRERCSRKLDNLLKELVAKAMNVKGEQDSEVANCKKQIVDKQNAIAKIEKEIEEQKSQHKMKLIELKKQHKSDLNEIKNATKATVKKNESDIAAINDELAMVKEKHIFENQQAQKAAENGKICREMNNELLKVETLWDELKNNVDTVQRLVLEHEDDEQKIEEIIEENENGLFAEISGNKKKLTFHLKSVSDGLANIEVDKKTAAKARNIINSIRSSVKSLRLEFNEMNLEIEPFNALIDKMFDISEQIIQLQECMLSATTVLEIFGAKSPPSITMQRQAIKNGEARK